RATPGGAPAVAGAAERAAGAWSGVASKIAPAETEGTRRSPASVWIRGTGWPFAARTARLSWAAAGAGLADQTNPTRAETPSRGSRRRLTMKAPRSRWGEYGHARLAG